MATLILTTVGTIVGGPIGGAVGALFGQAADRAIFAPKGRQGPRLGDRSVQISRYGEPIAKLFGTMRVAGSVIWATDLREERQRTSGGKGGGSATTYSYSASFAVALSARPILSVGRIWADGKLLRGAAGDWKSELGAFRLHLGSERQQPDPLIASAEGVGTTPAYRGTALAVFADLQLADFGNRIPSLTFEVEADEAVVSIATIARELTGDAMTGATAAALGGYAASGDSLRGAIETLATVFPLQLTDDGNLLSISDAPIEPVTLSDLALGASPPGNAVARRDRETEAAGTLPDEISIAYFEPERDYQAGLQRARRGGAGRRVEAIELPATLGAGEAKAAAERRLSGRWAERKRATVRLPWRHMALRPGQRVTLPDSTALWRIAGWTLDRMAVELRLVQASAGQAIVGEAMPGRSTPGIDMPAGETRIALLDLPPLDAAPASSPRIWIAAAGTEPGWRRAALSLSLDGGATWEALGDTAAPATIGEAATVLGNGQAGLIDRIASVEVDLLHDAMLLIGRDDDALVSGANLAMLGDELIQFGDAVQIAPRRWRLSRLLRGRRGTEWAMAEHAIGDRFVLVEPASLFVHSLPPALLGGVAEVMAVGIGDDGVPGTGMLPIAGRALRPPPPIFLTAHRLGDATLRFGWTRRSRIGWSWLDGSDAPLGEEIERYRLTITPDAGVARTVEIAEPVYDYDPDAQAEDGATAATHFTVEVSQLGSIGASEPAATRSFTL